jgi:hypothetical protein
MQRTAVRVRDISEALNGKDQCEKRAPDSLIMRVVICHDAIVQEEAPVGLQAEILSAGDMLRVTADNTIMPTQACLETSPVDHTRP